MPNTPDLKSLKEKAIKAAGGSYAVAEAINRSFQSIYKWKRIPAQHCQTISQMSDIPLHKIRPDIYPHPKLHFRFPKTAGGTER